MSNHNSNINNDYIHSYIVVYDFSDLKVNEKISDAILL